MDSFSSLESLAEEGKARQLWMTFREQIHEVCLGKDASEMLTPGPDTDQVLRKGTLSSY